MTVESDHGGDSLLGQTFECSKCGRPSGGPDGHFLPYVMGGWWSCWEGDVRRKYVLDYLRAVDLMSPLLGHSIYVWSPPIHPLDGCVFYALSYQSVSWCNGEPLSPEFIEVVWEAAPVEDRYDAAP